MDTDKDKDMIIVEKTTDMRPGDRIRCAELLAELVVEVDPEGLDPQMRDMLEGVRGMVRDLKDKQDTD